MVDTVVGAPSGAPFVDYIRLRRLWRPGDITDSIRDAQALFKIRFRIGRGARIQQQYRSLTASF
jgi:hypothetical protein